MSLVKFVNFTRIFDFSELIVSPVFLPTVFNSPSVVSNPSRITDISTISSANLRLVIFTPFIFRPLFPQFKYLKDSSKVALKSKGDRGSPCRILLTKIG